MIRITPFFILISSFIYSQDLIEVEYIFDDNSTIYNSKLVLSDSIMLFTIFDTKVEEKENDIVNTEKGISINVYKPKSQNRKLLQVNNDSLIYFNLNLGKKFYTIKEYKSKFEWTLEKESKIILNFKCNSARMKFRNKEYIAYYTSEIPVDGGPWKYNGLPGLILEIKSLDNKIKFTAYSVNTKTRHNKRDFLFKENELVEIEQFKKLSFQNIEKRKIFIEFIAAENGGSVETNFKNNHIDFTVTELIE